MKSVFGRQWDGRSCDACLHSRSKLTDALKAYRAMRTTDGISMPPMHKEIARVLSEVFPEEIAFHVVSFLCAAGHRTCALVERVKLCCECADQRPHREEAYEAYVDGRGMVRRVSRHEYYCPPCRDRINDEISEKADVEVSGLLSRMFANAAANAGPGPGAPSFT
eukprot:tig00021133_g18903.t1